MSFVRGEYAARTALAGLLVLVSCGGDNVSLQVRKEDRVVTTPGGSCGKWFETKSNPPTLTEVTATCGDGMSCTGVAYFFGAPPDQNGRYFKTCLPENALTCDEKTNPCPEPFGCAVGFGLPSTGACIHRCTTHSDCPDTYQLCDSGACVVLPCDPPTDASAGRGCAWGWS